MSDSTRNGYDTVAEKYAVELGDELRHKPLDRALLTAFAEQVPGERRIWDVGCGPGHITAFLAGLGVTAAGVDLSDGMLAQARLRHTDLEFTQGSMLTLPADDASWNGIVSFYSIIHLLDNADVRTALREFRRVLAPDGLLLLAVHIGDEVRHLDEWFGAQVDVSFRFFDSSWLTTELTAIGLTVEALTRRRPYPDVEVATDRAYFLCRAS
jgi:ubiquinone/menaquinone biosynthesis C-methylase UbiE